MLSYRWTEIVLVLRPELHGMFMVHADLDNTLITFPYCHITSESRFAPFVD